MRRSIFPSLLVSISFLALSGCAGGEPQGIEASKSTAPVPPLSMVSNEASDTLTPVSSVVTESSVVTTSAAPANAIEARMEKLEQAVGSLRTDYDRIMPAFASLNTTNERIQTLLDEIEDQGGGNKGTTSGPSHTVIKTSDDGSTTATTTSVSTTATTVQRGVTPTAGTVSAAVKPLAQDIARPSPEAMKAIDEMPVATSVTTTTTTTAPASAPSETVAATSSVKGVRIGEHGNKTRVVIDLGASAKPAFTQDLDNAEKLLLIDLPASSWDGGKTGAPKASAFITSWSVQDGAKGGSSLAIQLKKPAKIVSTQYLKAEGKDPARLVIDLGPAT